MSLAKVNVRYSKELEKDLTPITVVAGKGIGADDKSFMNQYYLSGSNTQTNNTVETVVLMKDAYDKLIQDNYDAGFEAGYVEGRTDEAELNADE